MHSRNAKNLENKQLLIIPGIESTGMKVGEAGMTQVPLKVVVLSLVSEATEHLTNGDTRRSLGNVAQQIEKEFEKTPVQRSLGLFTIQCNANIILQHVLRKSAGDTVKVFKESTTSCRETELNQCKRAQSFQMVRRDSTTNDWCSFGDTAVSSRSTELFKDQHSVQESASSCHETTVNQCRRVQSFQTVKEKSTSNVFSFGNPALSSLDRSAELSKRQRSRTSVSYHSFENKQHGKLEDPISVLRSKQRIHSIKQKLSEEQHLITADSYDSLSVKQHARGDFALALQSAQRALDIRLELLGEEHSSTADSYDSLSVIHHAQGDFALALQSAQRALDIRLELLGEEQSSTADSYDSLSAIQHAQGDFALALQSAQRALDIRLALFGEEHSSTADSYDSLSVTQHEQGDFASALQSAQSALNIRRKQFGEEHSSTADSYHSLGVTQHALGNFPAALRCKERALDIRRKLFGEEHSRTADSYDSLGNTQHAQARQFKQRASNIRLKLFEKENRKSSN